MNLSSPIAIQFNINWIGAGQINGNGRLILQVTRTLVSWLSSIIAPPQIAHFPPEGTSSRKFLMLIQPR